MLFYRYEAHTRARPPQGYMYVCVFEGTPTSFTTIRTYGFAHRKPERGREAEAEVAFARPHPQLTFPTTIRFSR